MSTKLCVGDLVKSLKGRDEGMAFLVINVNGHKAEIVNGKQRTIQNPKTKNVKHLFKLQVESLEKLATEIQSGKLIANKRVYKAIAQKIKED